MRRKRLRGDRPIRTLLVALAAIACQANFILGLFQPAHFPQGAESGLEAIGLARARGEHLWDPVLPAGQRRQRDDRGARSRPRRAAGRPARGLPHDDRAREGARGRGPAHLEVARTIRHDGTLDVWLLDEGDDRFVRSMCSDLGVRHFTRKGVPEWNQRSGVNKARTKHGNNNAWLAVHGEDYDVFVSVDPDHVPLPQFRERLLGYFRDPDVAFVVAPQVYGNYDNFVTPRRGCRRTHRGVERVAHALRVRRELPTAALPVNVATT